MASQVEILGGPDGAGGLTPGERLAVDRLRGSGRVSISPLDHSDTAGNLLGHYRTVCISGATASIGAGGILFSCRWAGPLPPVAVITRIQAACEVLTAVTVATPMNVEAIRYTGYTSADTGGGVVIPTKLRSAMSISSFADFRMATTAALGAGTRTLDSVGFGYASLPLKVSPDIGATGATGLAAGVGSVWQDLFKWEPTAHPLVLGVNEGFAIRQSVAGPTTGTVRWTFVIEHSEVQGF
jgi:hypothetical protein